MCARGAHPTWSSGPSTSPLERMLTAFDKLWWVAFTVVSLACMIAGACVPLIYLIPPEQLPAPRHNYGFGQVTLCLGGVALGYAASLTLFGFVSRHFVSAATHQRWAESLDNNTYVQYRAPGLAKLIRWALITEEHRGPQTGSKRSNNRWRGP